MHWDELYEEELREKVKDLGYPVYRGTQLFEAYHGQRKFLDEVSNLPKSFLSHFSDAPPVEIELMIPSKIDETKKFLYRLQDGQLVEGVLMTYSFGKSLCVSTQVGCNMGCKFCASTVGGKVRNLTTREMLGQVYAVEKLLSVEISHIILMGSGEPLDNYEEVLRFLRLLHESKGKNLSYRNMTISTCGIPHQIIRLSKEGIPVRLAISLHEPVQRKREKIMPVAKVYSLDQLFRSIDEYQKRTGQRITFEYTLIQGENDSREDAMELGKLLQHRNAHVNLIPLNTTKFYDKTKPTQGEITDFKVLLEKIGIPTTIRRSLGSDIDASCGQLKANYQKGLKV